MKRDYRVLRPNFVNVKRGESANGEISPVLSPKVKMKPGKNLSRFCSIFWCNWHQFDFYNYIGRVCSTSMLLHRKYKCNFEENSSDQAAALIFAWTYSSRREKKSPKLILLQDWFKYFKITRYLLWLRQS